MPIRLNVDNDVHEATVRGQEGVLDIVTNAVALGDAEGAVHLHVDVHVVTQTGLFHPQFFDHPHTGHGGADAAGFLIDFLGRRTVHVFMQGRAQQVRAIDEDDDTADKGSDVIGGVIALPADERDADADKRGAGGDGIRAMMPGVALQRRAGGLVTFAQRIAGQALFDNDDQDEDRQGEPRGRGVPVHDVIHALPGDDAAGEKQGDGGKQRGELLRTAMAIRVIIIWRLFSYLQTHQDHEGNENVADGLDAIGDEGIRMTHDAGGDLDHSQEHVHRDARGDGVDGDLVLAEAHAAGGRKEAIHDDEGKSQPGCELSQTGAAGSAPHRRAQAFDPVRQGPAGFALRTGEDVGDLRRVFERDGVDRFLHEAGQRGRQDGDAGPGGDHEGHGLGAGGLQNDARPESGSFTKVTDMRGKGGRGVRGHGDEGFLRQGFQRETARTGQGMPGGKKAQQRLTMPRDELDAGRPHGGSQADKAAIQTPGGDGLELVLRGGIVKHDLHLRMRFTIPAEGLHEFIIHHGADKAKPEPCRLAQSTTPGCLSCPGEQTREVACLVIEQAACCGEGDLARQAREKSRADLFLQSADVPGQRRLRQIQPTGSAGKGKLLRHGDEALKFTNRIVHTEKVSQKRKSDSSIMRKNGKRGGLNITHPTMAISDTIKRGAIRAPHRSLLRATGMIQSEDDWDKPFIAIANSFVQIIPGHVHLDVVGRKVREAVRAAGGVPFEFNTIGVDDGIAMGHGGMKYSLASRELIADCIETMLRAHCFDGMVCIPNCDKIVPGMMMGAARVNIPTLFVSGGPMRAGKDPLTGKALNLASVFEAVGQLSANTITEQQLGEIERNACPTCGSCSGMFTANSMNCLCEALGWALPGNGSILATDPARDALFEKAGRTIVRLVRDDVKPSDLLTRQAFENALALDMAMGGSSNTILHTLAIAREAGVPLSMADFNEISAKVPHICKVAPSGQYFMEDVDRAGGISAILKTLTGKPGILHEDCWSVTGLTIGETISTVEVKDEDVIRPLDRAYTI